MARAHGQGSSFHPPHELIVYIVKLGFTGVYINFLIFAQNKDCGYSLELPLNEVVLKSTHKLCLEQNKGTYDKFSFENLSSFNA